jgi:aspartate ammonia-lyase
VGGSTATATALVDRLGYTQISQLVTAALAEGKTIRQLVIERALLTEEEFDQLVSPEQVTRLGAADAKHRPEG